MTKTPKPCYSGFTPFSTEGMFEKEGRLAGRKRRRSRLQYLQSTPPHSWVHSRHYSVGDLDNVVYFLCTPHGPFTIHEEYWCWVYAATGHSGLARRMVYNTPVPKTIKPKWLSRVADLIDMDAEGVISLKAGPWKYYGYEIGDPSFLYPTRIKDYSECLITPITCRTSLETHSKPA